LRLRAFAAGRKWAPPREEDEQKRRQWERYKRWSRVGLALLVVGFALQIASNHVGVDVPTVIFLPPIPPP